MFVGRNRRTLEYILTTVGGGDQLCAPWFLDVHGAVDRVFKDGLLDDGRIAHVPAGTKRDGDDQYTKDGKGGEQDTPRSTFRSA